MIKLDDSIDKELNGLRASMKTLQRFWVKSGALLDEEDNYSVRVSEEFVLTYDPVDNSIGIYESYRDQEKKLVFQHGEKGLSYFSYHINEINDIQSTIFNGRMLINDITEKATNVSEEFGYEAKTKALSAVMLDINTMVMQKVLKGNANFERADIANNVMVFNSNMSSNESNSNVYLSIDFSSMAAKFLTRIPNGEANVIMELESNGNIDFFNNKAELSSKLIILKACLRQAMIIHHELKVSQDLVMENGTVKVRRQEDGSNFKMTL